MFDRILTGVRAPGRFRCAWAPRGVRGALLLCAVVLAAGFSGPLGAENWPGWRGASGAGAAPGRRPPLRWSSRENVQWRAPLSGTGAASPVVWGERVFVAEALAHSSTILCLDRASGRVLWQSGVTAASLDGRMLAPSRCSATPVTDGTRIIALFGATLCCYDFEGGELWVRDLPNADPELGNDASPLLHSNLCVVNLDASGRLIALDKETGKTVWESPGASGPGAGQPHSTPVIAGRPAGPELVVGAREGLFAYDPATGRLLWSCRGLGLAVEASPLWTGEAWVGAGALGGAGVMAVRGGGAGDVTGSRRQWRRELAPGCSASGVAREGVLYWARDDGVLESLSAASGRTLGRQRLPGGAVRARGSLLLAGERLYAPAPNGDVVVLSAGADLEVLCTNSVQEPATASLAASDGELFLRTSKSLWRLGEKAPAGGEVRALRARR